MHGNLYVRVYLIAQLTLHLPQTPTSGMVIVTMGWSKVMVLMVFVLIIYLSHFPLSTTFMGGLIGKKGCKQTKANMQKKLDLFQPFYDYLIQVDKMKNLV